MKRVITICSALALVATCFMFSSCGKGGHCYCTSSSPYVDYGQMNATANSITTEEGCEQYNHGSGGYFSCSWIKD